MNEIKPIQTYYDGHWFRSRLEARWAVVFNALGVPYEYEPEGFDLGGGMCYLPDFRVKCHGKRGDYKSTPFDLYIEVKGKMTADDAEKIKRFADIKEEVDVYCTNPKTKNYFRCERAQGFPAPYMPIPPGHKEGCQGCEYAHSIYHEGITNPILIVNRIPDEGQATDNILTYCSIGYGMHPFNYETIDGDYFGAYPAATKWGDFYLFGDDSNYINREDELRVERAYRLARCARFEHGERPPV